MRFAGLGIRVQEEDIIKEIKPPLLVIWSPARSSEWRKVTRERSS